MRLSGEVSKGKVSKGSAKWPIGPRGREGFTAIEVLVTMAVSIILVGVAIPLFGGVMQTYRLNAATRQVVADMRGTQSLAVSRGGIFGFHWGGDPLVGRPLSQYRVERDTTGACGFPLPTDTTGNPDVLTEWIDLTQDFTGITISSIQDNNTTNLGGVMFNSRGASVNPCVAVAFPVTITVTDTNGATRTIQVRSAGSVRVQ